MIFCVLTAIELESITKRDEVLVAARSLWERIAEVQLLASRLLKGDRMACEVWPDDIAPCGAVEVERLRFLNEWMDHPGHGQSRVQGKGINPSDIDPKPGPSLGLGVCEEHFAEYLLEHFFV